MLFVTKSLLTSVFLSMNEWMNKILKCNLLNEEWSSSTFLRCCLQYIVMLHKIVASLSSKVKTRSPWTPTVLHCEVFFREALYQENKLWLDFSLWISHSKYCSIVLFIILNKVVPVKSPCRTLNLVSVIIIANNWNEF